MRDAYQTREQTLVERSEPFRPVDGDDGIDGVVISGSGRRQDGLCHESGLDNPEWVCQTRPRSSSRHGGDNVHQSDVGFAVF